MTRYTTHISLLQRVSASTDPAAWREFCDRYGLLIRSFARRRALQPADCDEVVQDVLTALTQAMPGFEYDPTRGKFRGYLKTITLREIQKRYRQHRELPLATDGESQGVELERDDAALDQTWEDEWRQYHLRQAMRSIEVEFSEADREAFDLYAVHGTPAQETATRLQLSVDQVYQAKSRILKRIESLIERQVEDEG
ncbi:MAG: sigma-70 family RNA polymerase sigma factor [Planctomycetota bacterium]